MSETAQAAECARSRNTAGTHSPRWWAGEQCAWCHTEGASSLGVWLPAPPASATGGTSRDAEFAAMQAIVDALEDRTGAARRRVIRYALDLYGVPAERLSA